MFLGFPPPLASHHQLRYIKVAVGQLDDDLLNRQQAKIATHELTCAYSTSLWDVPDPLAKLSSAQTLDSSLEDTKQRHLTHWTCETEIVFQYAKLNLYSMALILPQEAADYSPDTQLFLSR
ncbi:hypothetical protein GQ53DRAFT_824445 [Thozetella sp. PMI_491]|nr:hypothetical protein GQ53DRAFT_824445 [Thozetella sp. PMI_491]